MSDTSLQIAIIGMAGRFPGAQDVQAFWHNLVSGVESVRLLSNAELERAGIPRSTIEQADYVGAEAALKDPFHFDPEFFGLSPAEAEIIDPQQRVFLTCCFHALEDAGYDSWTYPGKIGVFGGASKNDYLDVVLSQPDRTSPGDLLQAGIANDRDYLTTRVSYLLNLRGPSATVQTACSTSLVAVHMACQNLLLYQADMVLAGGVSIRSNRPVGHHYQEGMPYSRDGHTRTFDARSSGTTFGSGAGVVLLKRLDDAVRDGDSIHAVIRASVINNDGSWKSGYTAPSESCQAELVASALEMAQVPAETIRYIEAHGTGTPIGDPIEISALTRAFQEHSSKQEFCGIGSVKTNVGHLDTAAGIAGLIKTVLMLKEKTLVPSLNFESPNPQIDFANSPFYVQAKLEEWVSPTHPRRAGVSSFGAGGTNAHVILEEAPPRPARTSSGQLELLPLSGQGPAGLERSRTALCEYLANTDCDLSDIAYTLQVGRHPQCDRRVVVCQTVQDAIAELSSPDSEASVSGHTEHSNPSVAFLFPGGGSQYFGMGADLYRTQPEFRSHFDACLAALPSPLAEPVRDLMLRRSTPREDRNDSVTVSLPALFSLEYSLARLWIERGIEPDTMLGHSLGEYVAACLAEVFSLSDALRLVVKRAELLKTLPAGAMLSVALPEHEIEEHLRSGVSLAAVNGAQSCVVSGLEAEIERLERRLSEQGVRTRRLLVDVAGHSESIDLIAAEFLAEAQRLSFSPPRRRYLSNVSGTWVTAEQATSPEYWVQHLRKTVRFADNLAELLGDRSRVLLEVGPGNTLSTLASLHPDHSDSHAIVTSLPHPKQVENSERDFLLAAGSLWTRGIPLDWLRFSQRNARRRVSLPGSPLEERPFQLERSAPAVTTTTSGQEPYEPWLHRVQWVPDLLKDSAVDERPWLCFVPEHGIGSELVQGLRNLKRRCVRIVPNEHFANPSADEFAVRPEQEEDIERLFESLPAEPKGWRILFAYGLESSIEEESDPLQCRALWSLLALARFIGRHAAEGKPPQLSVLTCQSQAVRLQEPSIHATAGMLWGLVRVLRAEHPEWEARLLDMEAGVDSISLVPIVHELLASRGGQEVAFRATQRWVPTLERMSCAPAEQQPPQIRPEAAYLISGGLGRLGLRAAHWLANQGAKHLILLGRDQTQRPEAPQQLRELEERGVDVRVITVDVTDRPALEREVEALELETPLAGIIHAAGVFDHSVAITQCADRFRKALSAKVVGAWNLHQLSTGRKLDFFVLYSSFSSLLGPAGHSSYATANAYLDALAAQRPSLGLPALSINWGKWNSEATDAAWTDSIPLLTGHSALQPMLDQKLAQVAVVPPDLRIIEEWFPVFTSPLLTNGGAPKSVEKPHDEPPSKLSTQEMISQVWCDVLGVPQVGLQDDFNEIGGDSLLAMRVIARLRERFQLEIPLGIFLENRTIEGLLHQLGEEPGTTGSPLITAQARSSTIPASFPQKLLWLGEQVIPGSMLDPTYVLPTLHKIRGPLDVAALEQAVNEIIARHEALRTTLEGEGAQVFQVIHPPLPQRMETIDLRNANDPGEPVRKELDRPFDMARGPFLRATLFRSGEDTHLFALVAHRLAADGYSVGIIYKELRDLYEKYSSGTPSALPDLPIQLADFALWQHERHDIQDPELRAPSVSRAIDYWQAQLKDLKPPQLETGKNGSIGTALPARLPVFRIPSETAQALSAIARDHGTSLFIVGLTAHKLLLRELCNVDDIAVFTISANREHIQVEPLVGFFVEPLIIRTNLSSVATFDDALKRVHQNVMDAFKYHQELPMLKQIEFVPELFPAMATAQRIIFEFEPPPLLLNLPGTEVSATTSDGSQASPETGTMPADLLMTLFEGAEGLSLRVVYSPERWEPALIERLSRRYIEILDEAARNPHALSPTELGVRA